MKLHHFPPRVLRLSAVPAGAIGRVPLPATPGCRVRGVVAAILVASKTVSACNHEARYELCGYTKIIQPSDSLSIQNREEP